MITDSHCHIDFSAFDCDRDNVLQRASENQVSKIIIPGVMQKSWHKIAACCKQYAMLYPAYGLHPYFIDSHKTQHLDELCHWIDKKNPVAIGECGLDFYLKNLDKNLQTTYFEKQLDIALTFNLPVIIHARKSTEAVISAIKKRPGLRGMLHSFSGSYEQAQQLIKLGFYLSFGGSITYPKATRVRKLVQQLPLDFLLVETDAPDQPVASATSKRNEPACIIEVIKSIAELHKTSVENISNITALNTNRLFQLDIYTLKQEI